MLSMILPALFVSAVALLAAAAPNPNPNPLQSLLQVQLSPLSLNAIQESDAQCCQLVGAADSIPVVGTLLGLLDIVLDDLSVIVGITCTPISILGIGQGANCAQQPVCCTNNNFHGLINIGCVPISL